MHAHRKKKSLGQHFLRDARVAERAAEHAALKPDDVVLEIGPGGGVLTRVLAARAREVVAIELDRALADALAREAPSNVRVVHADAVEAEWPAFDACVSNLPYQVSSPVLFKLLARPFRVAVLMVQEEFAERLVARPDTSAYGRLSVSAATRARVEIVQRVGRGAFDPPPRVDSALVRVTPRPTPFPVADLALFDAVVKAAFTQRRKTLANALRNAAHLVASDAARVAALAPGALAPAEFAEVADHLAAAGLAAPPHASVTDP